MYHGFGKFIRGKGFSILFYLVSVLLMFYLTVKIGSVAEYVFPWISILLFLLF